MLVLLRKERAALVTERAHGRRVQSAAAKAPRAITDERRPRSQTRLITAPSRSQHGEFWGPIWGMFGARCHSVRCDRERPTGRIFCDGTISRCHLYFMPNNAIYAGDIVHRDKLNPGHHAE